MLEKTLESPLDCKEIKSVNPKGNQSWIFIERTDAEVEVPILCLYDVKNWLIRKEPGAGQDWRQEEKRTAEDEIVGCHHWPDGHEIELAPGDGEGQGNLACCSPWGHKELDTIEWLNNNNNIVPGDFPGSSAGSPGPLPLRRDRLQTPIFLGFLGGSDAKESTSNSGDLGLIPGLGRSPGEGNGNSL